jgi:pimeloyl-ACP methyl ester carboxylesterase
MRPTHNCPTTSSAQNVLLSDGRKLAFCQYGDANGRPLLYLHGAGSSRLEPAYADGYARQQGIRLIPIDRPGYGRSTAKHDYRFLSVARDVLELADALQLGRFSVAGMSAGAPFALTLAAMAPSRVQQVVLINGSSDSFHPAWQQTPLALRLLMRVASLPFFLNYAARSMKKNPAKTGAKMVARGIWTSQDLSLFKATIDEGMRQHDSVQLLGREAQMVLQRPWQLGWSVIQCPVLAICGLRDPGRRFYQQMAQQYPQISMMEIPGPHMPIVASEAWDRIGAVMAAQAWRPGSMSQNFAAMQFGNRDNEFWPRVEHPHGKP